MGFGFNLLLIFLILPSTVLLFLLWAITRRSIFLKVFFFVWSVVIGLVCLTSLANVVGQSRGQRLVLSQADYYGTYVVDRNYFKGTQADWQYNHFRFEITKSDSLYFHVTSKDRVLTTFYGTIGTVAPHRSARLAINMDTPYHVMASNPTTYRSKNDFYLVFYSAKYGNMFFRKGNWKAIPE